MPPQSGRPFYWAYITLWSHWIVAGALATLSIERDILSVLSSLALSSLALGLVVYGLFARRFMLVINAFCYASILWYLTQPSPAALGLFIFSAITGLTSSHALISSEYAQYKREVGVHHAGSKALWATGITSTAIVLLFALAMGISINVQRIFIVANPKSAKIPATIQKRITILVSARPRC